MQRCFFLWFICLCYLWGCAKFWNVFTTLTFSVQEEVMMVKGDRLYSMSSSFDDKFAQIFALWPSLDSLRLMIMKYRNHQDAKGWSRSFSCSSFLPSFTCASRRDWQSRTFRVSCYGWCLARRRSLRRKHHHRNGHFYQHYRAKLNIKVSPQWDKVWRSSAGKNNPK